MEYTQDMAPRSLSWHLEGPLDVSPQTWLGGKWSIELTHWTFTEPDPALRPTPSSPDDIWPLLAEMRGTVSRPYVRGGQQVLVIYNWSKSPSRTGVPHLEGMGGVFGPSDIWGSLPAYVQNVLRNIRPWYDGEPMMRLNEV